MRSRIVAIVMLAGMTLAGCAAQPAPVTGVGQPASLTSNLTAAVVGEQTDVVPTVIASAEPTVTVTAAAPVTVTAQDPVTVQPPVTVVAPAPRTVTAPAPEVIVVPAPDPYPGYYYTSGVNALPSGLYCRDLKALGYNWADATQYWILWGAPDNMDADLNGIPCETVY